MAAKSKLETLVTVFGGSGFLGRHVVRALAQRGYRIRVAVRRPDFALRRTRHTNHPTCAKLR